MGKFPINNDFKIHIFKGILMNLSFEFTKYENDINALESN